MGVDCGGLDEIGCIFYSQSGHGYIPMEKKRPMDKFIPTIISAVARVLRREGRRVGSEFGKSLKIPWWGRDEKLYPEWEI